MTTTPLETLTTGMQSYAVFKGLTSFVYACLWLMWLSSIDNAVVNGHAYTPKCRDIAPSLRKVLYVIAWVSIVATVLYICVLASQCLLSPSIEIVLVLIACAIIVGIYAYQIQYIEAVASSTRDLHTCSTVAPRKKQLVRIFAVVVGIFGLFMVLFGMWGRDYFERMASVQLNRVSSTKDQITTKIKRRSSRKKSTKASSK